MAQYVTQDASIKIGHWYSITICVSCFNRINRFDSATCPYCGVTSKLVLADTIKIVIRQIQIRNKTPWWMFWKSKWNISYEGRDESAQKWVNEKLNK